MQRLHLFAVIASPLMVASLACRDNAPSRLSTSSQAEHSTASQSGGSPFHVDLGYILVGSQQEIEYVLQNPTSEPWRVVRFELSCGCADARIDREVILPGGTARVILDFQAPSSPSDVKQKATLVYEDAADEGLTKSFTFSARVRTPITIKESHKAVGVSTIDGKISELLTVQGIGVAHLDDLSASADVDWIKCSISAHESSEQNRDRDSGAIPVKTLTLTGKVPQRAAGRVHARVELRGGGHAVSLPVFVDLQPVIRVFPTLSVLGTSRQETTEHRIIPSPGLSLSADSVRLDFDDSLVQASIRKRRDHLSVHISAGRELGPSSKTDVLLTVPGVSDLSVPIGVSMKCAQATD